MYVVLMVTYGATPYALDVGYQPDQPVLYSHELHAGQLGMDCRYCHIHVEKTAHATIPPTTTCMNCHATIRADSAKIKPLYASYTTGMPVEWVRIHDLPDFVYFNHSAHVQRGVGCVSCHGRIDRMETVYQAQPLSMSWCLDCHRYPDPHLRPPEEVTNMGWTPPGGNAAAFGKRLREENHINPSTDCSTCHR